MCPLLVFEHFEEMHGIAFSKMLPYIAWCAVIRATQLHCFNSIDNKTRYGKRASAHKKNEVKTKE